MKLLDTILFILSATYMHTKAAPPGDRRDKRAIGPVSKEEAFYTMVEGLHKMINQLHVDRDQDREEFRKLEDKVYHHQKTIHKLRVQLHGLSEQQTANENEIQNLQTNFSEKISTLTQKIQIGAEEKANFSGAVYNMSRELLTIQDSIRGQKTDLEQLQFTFQHVIEAEFGKPKKQKKSRSKDKVKPTNIPLFEDIDKGSGDLGVDLNVNRNLRPNYTDGLEPGSGDLSLNSSDLDQGSGDLDPNLATPTQEPQHSTTMFTSTNSEEDEVDITNNGILHVFSNDFADKLIKQADELNNLKVRVSTLNSTVQNLEEQILEKPNTNAQNSADLLRDTFTNLTQQLLTIQQQNTINLPNISNTFSDKKELERLFSIIMETKKTINDLAKESFDEKIEYEEKMTQIDFKVFQMNKTVSTAVRRLEKYKDRSRDSHNDIGDKIGDSIEKNAELEQRLAHVEVKVFNASLQKCLKKDRDFEQDNQIGKIIQDLKTLISVSEKSKRDFRRLKVSVERNDLTNDQTTKVIGDLLGLTKNLTVHIPELLDAKAEVDNFVEHLPLDCTEIYHKGIRHTGIYLIKPLNQEGSVPTYCDMDNDDGWTLIQRRIDGSTDFNRDWYDYKFGFGDARGDFWIGNDNIYYLTIQDDYMLQIDMWDMNNVYWYALYEDFYITSGEQDFILTVNNYTGNATDSLSYSSGMKFSSPDVDNDASSTFCASFYEAGWWYKHCQFSNLNGRFDIGMVWFNYEKDEWMQMKKSVMKIKPRNSNE